MTTIYVTHSTLTDDDATGHGLTENIYDLAASNETFNRLVANALRANYPGVTVKVTNSDRADDTRAIVDGDDLDDDEVRQDARDIVGTLYGQGDFWVEAVTA